MTPYYADDLVTLHLRDCRDVMAAMETASVDAVVTDPPYELGFMGRQWDASGIAYDVGVWREALRLLKPGGHLLAFGGTRTYHRMACAIEDAGFEIRDSLHWIYGSGFPKSLDVSKAIDKAAGAEREVVGERDRYHDGRKRQDLGPVSNLYEHGLEGRNGYDLVTAPATDDAARWVGFGTALKPAHEPIVCVRKPLAAGTVAANVLEFGTGALNVDGCRVGTNDALVRPYILRTDNEVYGKGLGAGVQDEPTGRWPTNIAFTHSAACTFEDADDMYQDWCAPDCPVAELDRQSGVLTTHAGTFRREVASADRSAYQIDPPAGHVTSTGDTGGASRFYPVFRYQAKAPSSERPRLPDGTVWPTVKPLDLMRWLVRLVTPPGGIVLDPFAGTGTTGQACALEGFRCVLAERDPDSAELARIRLAKPVQTALGLGAFPLAVTA